MHHNVNNVINMAPRTPPYPPNTHTNTQQLPFLTASHSFKCTLSRHKKCSGMAWENLNKYITDKVNASKLQKPHSQASMARVQPSRTTKPWPVTWTRICLQCPDVGHPRTPLVVPFYLLTGCSCCSSIKRDWHSFGDVTLMFSGVHQRRLFSTFHSYIFV